MDLVFWRHAEAEEPRDGLADIDRALTERGEQQAQRVGAWLNRQVPQTTVVLCSPALRCQQTALRLGREFIVRDELASGRPAASMLEAALRTSAGRPVMLIGHQPALGDALAKLLQLQDSNCHIRKAAAWWLRTQERNRGVQAVVWAVQSPETAGS
jgi:phosphohistidine phosphatase